MREDVKTLTAGRELDAEVAEKVMGCKVVWAGQFPTCDCMRVGRYGPHTDDYDAHLLHYSGDIDAAMHAHRTRTVVPQ